MPIVPSGSQRNVSQRPVENVFQSSQGATADAFGASRGRALEQTGRALSGLGNELAQMALKTQIEDNERRAKELDIAFSKSLRSVGYGDGTEQNQGFYSTRGQNTLNQREPVRKAIEKARREIGADITNPRVQEMFTISSALRIDREFEAIDRFTAKERRVANDTVSEARINEFKDDAAAAWNSPELLNQSIAGAQAEVHDMAERNGWAPEVTASKLQEAQTIIYRTSIVAALKQDPVAAQAIYDANKSRIDGRARPEIEQLLEQGTTRVESQQAADEIMAMNLSETASLEEARKLEGAVRDGAITRIRQQFADQGRAQKQAFKDTSAEFFRAIMLEGKTLAQVSAENPEGANLLFSDPNTARSLQSAEKAVILGQRFNAVTDGTSFLELSKFEPDELAEVDLVQWQHRLTKSEFDKAGTLQRSAQKSIRANEKNRAVFSAGIAALARMAPKSMKFGQAGASDKKRGEARSIVNSMNLWSATFTDQGKIPTQQEINREAARLMLPIISDPNGIHNANLWSFKGFAGQARDMSPEQFAVVKVEVDNIPRELITAIDRDIREAGLTVTDELRENIAGAIATNNIKRRNKLLGIQ